MDREYFIKSSYINSNIYPEYDMYSQYDTTPEYIPTVETEKVPFYQVYALSNSQSGLDEEERDLNRMRSMYPYAAREIQHHVEEQCDLMEYDGSMMYDEYPDRLMMRRLTDHIYEKVKNLYDGPEIEVERDEMLALNRRPEYRYPRRNWMEDLVEVMLFNEVFRRRCRRRNCRRFWY